MIIYLRNFLNSWLTFGVYNPINSIYAMKLLKRSAVIARYFLFNGSLSSNIKKHKEIKETLSPFIANKLMDPKTTLLYLRKYVSTALPVDKSREILLHHYTYLKRMLPFNNLQHLFSNGIVCYTESNYKIILSGSEDREREGSLSLYFKDGDLTIAQLSFTITNGKTFNVADNNIAVISRFQQISAHLENITEAKKFFGDIMPTLVLFTVLEAICVSLNIEKVLGINGKDQLSWEPQYERSYSVNYDEFWMRNGGTATQYGYLMDCPFPQKDLNEIKQSHRNRARKKRERLEAIYNYAHTEINKLLIGKILPLYEQHSQVG
jgi:uncharacterized protein VirK/YbjX